MIREKKIELIKSYDKWWHSLEIEKDLVTPGLMPLPYLQENVRILSIPENLEGMRVLDIGAFDGFFSFEFEKRGASEVVAFDIYPFEGRGIQIAKTMLESKIKYVQGSVYQLSKEKLGEFDIVLFSGVFYHLRHPLLALDKIWEVTRQYMLFETHFIDHHVTLADGSVTQLCDLSPQLNNIPIFQYFPKSELDNEPSNWFSPNKCAIECCLRSSGFDPQFLGVTRNDRIFYKATKLEGVQECMAIDPIMEYSEPRAFRNAKY